MQVILKTFKMEDKSTPRSGCPLSCSLDIWGDKWSLLIIRDILFNKKNTYGEFLRSPEKMATNILASRLQHLEKTGIISKTDHPESKVKNLYKLTAKGIGLIPMIVEAYLWADTYLDLPLDFRKQIDGIRKNKQRFITSLTEAFSEPAA